MRKKITILYVILFLGIVCIPLILFALQIKVEPQNKGEKKISLNFKRNFPLRDDLFKVYAQLKTNVIDTETLPNSVVTCENDWKFLGNKFSNALSESKGILVFNKAELERIKNNLLEKKKWYKKEGINLYITIAPNKHSIYGDLIPIQKRNRKTKVEQIDSICQSLGIKFLNLKADFPKDSKTRLYHKTDSHWNHLGGFYAYKSTLDLISKDFKNTSFRKYTIDDIKLNTYWAEIGDLNGMLFIKKNEEFIDIDLSDNQAFTFTQGEKKLKAPFNYRFSDKYYEERYHSDVNDLKIIVFRDSFFGAYYKFIAENFGNSLFIWWHNFNPKLIKNEKPDIVCYEIVERNIDLFLTPDFKHSHN